MFSSARSRGTRRGSSSPVGVDSHDVEVEGVRVARVARERLDAVQLGDRFVVRANWRLRISPCAATLSSWQSAIAASTSDRFAL